MTRTKGRAPVNVAILGTGSYLPETVLTSAELGERLGVGEQWILDKTRIKERRVAAPDEATSDLATEAGKRALSAAGVDPERLDLVVLATSTGDQPIPATACHVQASLQATNAVAFDVMAVCTGFVYALAVARDMLLANDERQTALVVGSDVYSRILDYTDRRTAPLFGDGAGAVVLGKTGEGGIVTTSLGTDGTLADVVQIEAGGSRMPPSIDSIASQQHYFRMQGRRAREVVEGLLPSLVADLLKPGGMSLADVDLIVAHQANGVMLEEWEKNLAVAPGVIHETVRHHGNTGAASVPITLDAAVRAGRLAKGDTVLMIAFGGGVTWGGATVRWGLDSLLPSGRAQKGGTHRG